MRIIGTLTTIPSRIKNLKPVIDSLVDQTRSLHAIYLNIPYQSSLEKSQYNIPEWLSDHCHIFRCKDYGPITKFVGPLLKEDDPETIIITFDDDKKYPAELVEKMVILHQKHPNTAIGSTGVKIGKFPFYYSSSKKRNNDRWFTFTVNSNGEKVDILSTRDGAMYLRSFFPDIKKMIAYQKRNTSLQKNCDIVVAGFLRDNNIKQKIFKLPDPEDLVTEPRGILQTMKKYWGYILALYLMQREGFFTDGVSYQKTQTLTFPAVVIVGVLLLIAALVIVNKIN